MKPGPDDRFRDADVVVVGPAPPLRGGIAAHGAGLVGHLHARGISASALSYRRLYPAALFPGRFQRRGASPPDWVHEELDVLRPWSARRCLDGAQGKVVVQWWHPVVAPALLAAIDRVERDRLVVVVHNAAPHEWFPGSRAALRALLGRCGLALCHSPREAAALASASGASATEIVVAPLPCLVPAASLAAGANAHPPGAPSAPTRLFVAAGHRRPYKGTALLLDAWTSARRPPDARLVLVGESYLGGADRRRLLARCAKDPSILVVDRYVDDVEFVSWLTVADVVLAPHLRASQSGVLSIAAALGVPAIVSDAGALPTQAGPGSSVVPAGDRRALVAALEHRFGAAAAGPADFDARRRKAAEAAENLFEEWRAVVEAMGITPRP